jgi:phosphoserine phosphatase
MDSVLVLIAASGSRAIDDGLAEQVGRIAGASGAWLADGEAIEFPIPSSWRKPAPVDDPERVVDASHHADGWVPAFGGMTELEEALRNRPVDFALLPAANRRKRLLVADMDSTMIGEECIDELGALAGLGAQIGAITARAMAGELDFEASLRERVALLAGLDEAAIASILANRITFRPGGATVIATMKANGAHTALVSGGFVQFTGHVAGTLGFHEHLANELIIKCGKLAGTVCEPILGRDAKLATLHMIARRLGISPHDAIAVGDGANDIPMLKAAGIGVALHAKPLVRAQVPVHISHGDLTALLYLQGYRRDEFVIAT